MASRSNRANNRDRYFGIATLDRLYHRAVRAQRRRREKSEVGCFLKHFLFSLNVIFMVNGIARRFAATNFFRVDLDIGIGHHGHRSVGLDGEILFYESQEFYPFGN